VANEWANPVSYLYGSQTTVRRTPLVRMSTQNRMNQPPGFEEYFQLGADVVISLRHMLLVVGKMSAFIDKILTSSIYLLIESKTRMHKCY